MKKLLIIICMLLLTGCNSQKSEIITYQELTKLENYILVDVRTEQEFEINHLPNAQNIPLDTIDSNINLDKTKPIVVYCQSGNRSNQALMKLKALGFTVYDFGSIENWKGTME